MKQETAELVVIGGGPAGMAAALAAREHGVREIVILERERELGGILQQCIHSGFGLHYFGEELTGPEYAERFSKRIGEAGIPVKTDTMVLEVTAEKEVYAVSRADGMVCYEAKSVVLAMGCRERTREAIGIPGTRPAGIFTAGAVQRYINMEGYLPGKRVLILGSGDIGLIMARRLTLEGAEVLAVLEIMPYSNGLKRNVVQCLDDFEIPLLLQHTVVEVHGRERVTGVTVARVDEELRAVPGTERYWEADTLLLSVGLIPENELAYGVGVELDPLTGGAVVDQERETSVPGVFACGNVLHVHDLVDYVTKEAWLAGAGAAGYVDAGRENERARVSGRGEIDRKDVLPVRGGGNVRYIVPQRVYLPGGGDLEFYLRVTEPMENGMIVLRLGNEVVMQRCERYLRPAEMVSIRVDRSKLTERWGLARRHGKELVITVEEVV